MSSAGVGGLISRHCAGPRKPAPGSWVFTPPLGERRICILIGLKTLKGNKRSRLRPNLERIRQVRMMEARKQLAVFQPAFVE